MKFVIWSQRHHFLFLSEVYAQDILLLSALFLPVWMFSARIGSAKNINKKRARKQHKKIIFFFFFTSYSSKTTKILNHAKQEDNGKFWLNTHILTYIFTKNI